MRNTQGKVCRAGLRDLSGPSGPDLEYQSARALESGRSKNATGRVLGTVWWWVMPMMTW